MKPTAAQRAALDGLPPKRRAFVLALVGEAGGNQTKAAQIAGYREATKEGSRLLTFDDVRAAVDAFRIPSENRKVWGIEEMRDFWTKVAAGEIEDVSITKDGVVEGRATLATRMRATELLGKSQGVFIDRHEHSGEVAIVALQRAVAERLDRTRPALAAPLAEHDDEGDTDEGDSETEGHEGGHDDE